MKIKQQLKQVWFNTLMKNFKLNWKVKEWVGGCVFVQCEHSVRYVKTEHEVWSRFGSEVWLHDSVSFLCRPLTRLSACIYIRSYTACVTVWCIFYNPTQQRKRKNLWVYVSANLRYVAKAQKPQLSWCLLDNVHWFHTILAIFKLFSSSYCRFIHVLSVGWLYWKHQITNI